MSAAQGGSFADRAARSAQAIAKKRRLTAALRQKNLAKLQSAGVEVILGRAAFTGPQTLSVALPDGGTQQLQGGHIFINTGAQPNLPAIPGLKESCYTYTSQTLMELDALPAELVIIGGGYIGLEFASYYQNFGARVTVVQNTGDFMPREDAEVAAAVRQSLQDRGVQLLFGAQVQRVESGWRTAPPPPYTCSRPASAVRSAPRRCWWPWAATQTPRALAASGPGWPSPTAAPYR